MELIGIVCWFSQENSLGLIKNPKWSE